MKISILLLIVSFFQVNASSFAQRVTIDVKEASLEHVLDKIREQTNYDFLYNSSQIKNVKSLSLHFKDADLKTVLDACLRNQGLTYELDKRTVLIKPTSSGIKAGEGKLLIQQREIAGKVTNEKGEPLVGATLLFKDIVGLAGNSDDKGNYRIAIPENAKVLIVSFMGYKPHELIIGTNYIINVQLFPMSQSLEDVVVVGYGTQKMSELSTAISKVDSDDLKNQAVNNVTEALAGKMAGVQIAQGNGEPGATLNMKIRGVSTITAGASPLFVIDGTPIQGEQLNGLNTNDIESIEVLKDAASAAIYGSRGSNGVVIITTKQGKKGKTIFNYDSYYGVQTVAKTIQMLNAYQYSEIARDARNNTYIDIMEAENRKRTSNGNSPLPFSIDDDNGARLANTGDLNTIIPTEILPYLEGQQGLTNTNWQNEIYRAAPMQNHSISVSGGSERNKFYASLDYLDQEGIIINSDFKRYSGRLNLRGNERAISYGVNISPSVIQRSRVDANGPYNSGGIVASALQYAPIFPVYNADGSYSFAQNSWSGDTKTVLPGGDVVEGNAQTWVWNPVASAMLNKNTVDVFRMVGNAFFEVPVFKDLKYKMNLGIDLVNERADVFSPSTIPLSNTGGNPPATATGSSSTSLRKNWVWENTLNFSKKINGHSIEGLAGWTIQKLRNDDNSVNATQGFISDQITTVNAGIVTNGSSSATEWSLASALARIQYNYLSKYMLTVAYRADGSSRFGANSKWGSFPSVSAAWNISKEPFLSDHQIISDLKLRTSYGLTGNFNIPNYGAQGNLGYIGYVLGGATPTVVNGAWPARRPNPDLSWEKTEQVNIGLDVSFWNGALTLTADAYRSNTKGLLLDVPIPLSTGFETELRNIGEVSNKGLELTVGTRQKIGSVRWEGSLNYAKNINKVVSLGPGNADIIRTGGTDITYYLTRVGQPIGSYYLPRMLGVFQNQAEIDAYPHYIDAPNNFDLATSKPGDYKYEDADGDGVIDLTNDRVILGSYLPKFTYGFSSNLYWKQFDLGFAFQGVYGNKILNLSRRYFFNVQGNMNNYMEVYDGRYIDEANPGNGVARANRVSQGGNGVSSSRNVEDGSYLRLRNINLGYSFSKKLLDKNKFINSARIYISMQNPITWSKYSGYNPEVSNSSDATAAGEDYGVYPVSKTNSIGISLTF